MNTTLSSAIKLTSVVTAVCLLSACSQQPVRADAPSATAGTTTGSPRYVARLQPMNSGTAGSDATATATFDINGDNMMITIDAKGLPPNIEHWQHFHGFTDTRSAQCPTASADANGDGIVDLIETEAISGTTMVPFDADPAAMDVPGGKYPHADAKGRFSYRQNVSIAALEGAFADAFDGQTPDLERRVIFIHGVVPDSDLPKTVQSLGPIPAHVTLPIACGVIERR